MYGLSQNPRLSDGFSSENQCGVYDDICSFNCEGQTNYQSLYHVVLSVVPRMLVLIAFPHLYALFGRWTFGNRVNFLTLIILNDLFALFALSMVMGLFERICVEIMVVIIECLRKYALNKLWRLIWKLLVGVEPNPGPSAVYSLWQALDTWLPYFDFESMISCENYFAFCDRILTEFEFCSLMTHRIGAPRTTVRLCAAFRKCFPFSPKPSQAQVEEWELRLSRDADVYGWVLDLTTQGIEPNPGPVMSTMAADRASFLSDLHPQMLPDLFKFGLNAKTVDVIQDFSDNVERLVDNGTKIDINHNIPFVEKLLSNFSDCLPVKKFVVMACAIGFKLYSRETNKYELAANLLCMYAIYAWKDDIMLEIVNFLNAYSEATGEFEPQMDQGTALVDLLFVGVYFWTFGSKSKTTVETFLKSMTDMPKMRDGLDFYLDRIFRAFQMFINFCTESVAGVTYFEPNPAAADITRIAKNVLELSEDVGKEGNYTYEHGWALTQLDKELKSLLEKLPRSKSYDDYRSSITKQINTIKPMILKAERSGVFTNGVRKEPLGVMIGGPSGTGKSTSIYAIMLAVLASVIKEPRKREAFVRNHADFIYTMVPENEYADSYHGQFCTFWDEAGATKDAPGNPDIGAMMILRMINNVHYPMHMAHLEDKGTTHFSSKLIFATTNVMHFDYKSMTSSEAFTRRFKCQVVCVPKEEFCKPGTYQGEKWDTLWKRRLDVSKLKDDAEIDFGVWEYYGWDFFTGKGTTSKLTFDEFVDTIVSKFQENETHGDKVARLSERIKTRYLKPQMGTSNFTESMNKLVSTVNTPEVLLAMAISIPMLYTFWSLVLRPYFFPQGEYQLKNKNISKRILNRSGRRRALKGQAAISDNGMQFSSKLMRKSLYNMMYDGRRLGCALFIKGRVAMIPKHFVAYFEGIEPTESVVIRFNRVGALDVSFEIDLDDIEFDDYSIEGCDVAFMKFPKVVHCHPDLTSNFLSQKELGILGSRFDGVLALSRNGVDMCIGTPCVISGPQNYAEFSIDRSVLYSVATKVGDCGIPLLVCDSRLSRNIILGIHVAGNGIHGIGNILFSEKIASVIEALTANEVTVPLLDDEVLDAQMGKNFVVLNRLRKLRLPTKTNLMPSKFYGLLASVATAPAMLFKKHGVDPWELARSKYSKPAPRINLDLLDICGQIVAADMRFNSYHQIDPTIFSFEKAVSGEKGAMFWDGIPRNTSSGYPYNLDNKTSKKNLFGGDGEYTFNSDGCLAFKKILDAQEILLKQGVRPSFYYADYLKDERRPKDKVAQGKTRLISASPLDLTIHMRRYFGAFVQWCMCNNVNNGIAVGVNPYSMDWTRVARRLKTFGDLNIFGDYSGYDGSLFAALMYEGLKIIETFYYNASDEDRLVRATLFEDVVNSIHVKADGEDCYAYEWTGSNPSGEFLTTILNSVCNLVAILYANTCVVLENKGYSIYNRDMALLFNTADFVHKNTRSIVFGDDNGTNYSPQLAAMVPASRLVEMYKRINLTYTVETKDGSDVAYKSLDKCSFLKRGFVYDASYARYLAPLDLSVIVEMISWTNKGCTDETFCGVVDNFFRELSLHPEKEYNNFTTVFYPLVMDKLNYQPKVNQRLNRELTFSLDFNY